MIPSPLAKEARPSLLRFQSRDVSQGNEPVAIAIEAFKDQPLRALLGEFTQVGIAALSGEHFVY
jgi:hypothetical protein